MFTNIGGKIKTLATVICFLGILASFIGGIAVWSIEPELAGLGFVIIAVGSFSSWIGSFFMYGFGQLVENSDKIANGTVVNPGSQNDANDQSCHYSGTDSYQVTKSDNSWECFNCGTRNTSVYCVACGSKKNDEKSAGKDWCCSKCGNIWPGNVSYCTCGQVKP